ncbi:MAG: helix-turn-helix domain-containing protein [Acidimicrobiales bacterium]|nr:helix-turn-helix domain-containing protein [Acidimicrobiales bacterium]
MAALSTSGASSGVSGLDDLLEGGLLAGDNVVLLGEHAAAEDALARAFVSHRPTDSAWIALDEPPALAHTEIEVTRLALQLPADLETATATIVRTATARPRLVVSGLHTVEARHGSGVAIELYRRCCPRLFELGAVACWPVPRPAVAPTVVTTIGQIAQVVIELRNGALRVAKAEGRSSRVQGAMAELRMEGPDTEPQVGRDLVTGRLGEGLRRLRGRRNLTQRQLAELAMVTPAAISQAESGRRGLSLETLVVLSDALGTGIDDLLGDVPPRGHVLARRDARSVQDGATPLFDAPEHGSSVYRIRLERAAVGRPPFTHKGPELVLVARGLVLIDLGADTPVMRGGDALRVAEDAIARWRNLGDDEAELFWLAEAPTR